MKSMPLQSRLSFRICCALLIPLCGLASCSQSEETEAAAFAPTGTVLEFMNWYLEPQADVLWDSAGYIVTEDGEVDLQPTTQEGWDNVRNAATVVAESGNLLMIPGYAVDSDWMEYSRGLITAGIKAREAAQAKDADALFQAGAQLYSVCLACHNRYIVQTQEGG
ncbi:MAG: hypothetical protein NXH95_01790 [Pseudomonadaceae bacterium]|nr:hypothetical protein [Pseudomonadaceae bacterium]